MTLTFNTFPDTPPKNFFGNTFGISKRLGFCFVPKVKDVVIVVETSSDDLCIDLSEKELTLQAMNFSESSFAEEWNQESDEFWNNY